MEILSFMLGVSAVLIILGVVVMFSMYKKIKSNSEKIKTLNETNRDIWKQIDEIHNRVFTHHEDSIRQVNFTEERLRRDIDSRLDKLENKLKTKTSKEVL